MMQVKGNDKMVTIAVCDDEKRDRESMSELIKAYVDSLMIECHLEVYESGKQFMDSGFVPDILFLDIVMHDKDGIQIGFEVRKRYENTLIVYITNLREKMMTAFNKLHVFGYLVKPIRKKELFQMLTDAMEELRHRQSLNQNMVMFRLENSTVIRLPVSDIYYFEYINRRIKIVTKDAVYWCKDKIGGIAEKMEKYGFVMSHQGFVVNLYQIHLIKEQSIIMKNGDEVFLAQRRASAVRDRLLQIIRESQ